MMTQRMSEQQRTELLEQVYQNSGTIGSSIPETVRIEDETVPLREFYFEIADRDHLQETERERIREVLSYLRRQRLQLIRRVREREVDYETGQSLVPRIQSLDRAINAFESLDEPRFEEQVRREKIESARELVDLMQELGKL
ncbi:DUF5788 family protein (plasmid) [Halorussus limi]|uniref:DUF5788 family protein n=1 Tax=Halorussus limi TaxID=2938695 RepID=A0A8U0I0W7_9EURY|nr:DUF5788 family protein [Halorussus limi]UPV76799.1 DUF5788 family protein [Halorussus limi]